MKEEILSGRQLVRTIRGTEALEETTEKEIEGSMVKVEDIEGEDFIEDTIVEGEDIEGIIMEEDIEVG